MAINNYPMVQIIIRERISSRGGGVEISLTHLGYPAQKMTAYQNYLGGGMLSSIGNDCTIEDWEKDPVLVAISGKLSEYFHLKTNPDSEWESSDFDDLQNRNLSAY